MEIMKDATSTASTGVSTIYTYNYINNSLEPTP